MYDFSSSEISEPIKTIAWLLQNKPERFSLSEDKNLWQTRVVDGKTGKIFYIQNACHGNDPYVIKQDWMSVTERLYLAQEVFALIGRSRDKEHQKEKAKWLEAYEEDVQPEPVKEVSGPEYKLTPLEKTANDHATLLLALREQHLDRKRRIIIGFLAGLCLVIPLIVLYASK